MNKYTIISISSFFSLFFLGIYFYGPISTYLQEQALENLYTELGNLPIDNKLKEKIDLLAQEIGVTSPLIVNKMNCNATQLLGYHNCFITYPRSCLNIITFNKPHMFISEGFFENLSVDEQRFILGHELIHVREGHHGRYFTLISMSIKICTLLSLIGIAYLFLFCFKKKLRSDKIKKNTLYAIIIYWILFIFYIFCFLYPLAENSFRRYIEKQADILSIKILNTHKGAQELFDRWHKECNMPLESCYGDIFSDHPSLTTRKHYCLKERPLL